MNNSEICLVHFWVSGVGENVALGRPAEQSPDPGAWSWIRPAEYAVDGNRNGYVYIYWSLVLLVWNLGVWGEEFHKNTCPLTILYFLQGQLHLNTMHGKVLWRYGYQLCGHRVREKRFSLHILLYVYLPFSLLYCYTTLRCGIQSLGGPARYQLPSGVVASNLAALWCTMENIHQSYGFAIFYYASVVTGLLCNSLPTFPFGLLLAQLYCTEMKDVWCDRDSGNHKEPHRNTKTNIVKAEIIFVENSEWIAKTKTLFKTRKTKTNNSMWNTHRLEVFT